MDACTDWWNPCAGKVGVWGQELYYGTYSVSNILLLLILIHHDLQRHYDKTNIT